MRSPVRIWPAAPRRSKVRFAPAFSISRGIENTIRSAPLLLLSNPNPLCWASGLFFGWNGMGPGAFSSYRIAFRTGELTGEACFNKTRRPPEAVAASSNLASSSTSEQASYRLLRFFMPMAKKSECAHSAAPPFKPEPAFAGLRVCFLGERGRAGRFFRLQYSISNWRAHRRSLF